MKTNPGAEKGYELMQTNCEVKRGLGQWVWYGKPAVKCTPGVCVSV